MSGGTVSAMLSRNMARIGVLAGISVLVLGSASSRQTNNQGQPGGMPPAPAPAMGTPPAPQPMAPEYAHGFWESSFGSVRIDRDTRVAAPEAVTGTWTYSRGGQYVTGYFAGSLRGNVLDFSWTEPLQPPLNGVGFLVFDAGGTSFSGSWWTNNRDRSGSWTGWRGQASTPVGAPAVDPGASQPAAPNPAEQPAAPTQPAPGAPQTYYPPAPQPAPQPYYPGQPTQPTPPPPNAGGMAPR